MSTDPIVKRCEECDSPSKHFRIWLNFDDPDTACTNPWHEPMSPETAEWWDEILKEDS